MIGAGIIWQAIALVVIVLAASLVVLVEGPRR